MVRITANEKSLLFTFTNSNHYFQNGTVEVPKNSLALIVDDSDMATFKKSASNDIFISASYTELGMSKAELISWFEENGFSEGGGGGLTPEETQEMIDESISGKADTTAMTEALTAKLDVSSFNTYSGGINTAITSIEGDITDVQTALQGKASQSDLTALEGVVETKASNADLQALESVVGGKLNASDFNTYSANVNTELASKASNADLNTLSGVVDTKADKTEIPDVSNYIDNVDYDSANHLIKFFHNQTLIDSVDATDFIKDGMVSNVYIEGGNLVISFNTDAGKEDIEIPLTDIFNPNNYYDKTATDTLLNAKLNVSDFNTYSGGVDTDIASIEGDIVDVQTALQGKASETDLQTVSGAVDTKLAISDFNSYSSSTMTLIGNKASVDSVYDKATINSYTAATATVLNGAVQHSEFDPYSSSTEMALSERVRTADFAQYTSATDATLATKASNADLQTLSGNIKTIIQDNELVVANALIALQDDVDGKADESDLNGKVDVSTYTAYTAATDTVLQGKADASTFNNYVPKSEFNPYSSATQMALTEKVDTTAFTAYSASVATAIDGKQAVLVSGTNIKTINNTSLLGSGNIDIQGGGQTVTSVTQAEYDSLTTKDPDTFYIISDATGSTITIDPSLDSGSTNAVVNSAITIAIDTVSAATSSNTTSLNGLSLWKGTTAQYEAIVTKDNNTIYFVVD